MAAQCLCRGGRWNEGTGQIAFARLPRQATVALSGVMAYQQIQDHYVTSVGFLVQTIGVQNASDLFALIVSMITADFA